LADAFKRDAVLWSRAQKVTIVEQLQCGVRYLDLRIILRPDSNPSSPDSLWTCHGLYGSPLREALSEIQSFLAEHPREVILIDCAEFHEAGLCDKHSCRMSSTGHEYLVGLIHEHLSRWVFPKDIGCTLTLNQIWGTPYRVFVFYRNDNVASSHHWLWPRSKYLRSSWKNEVNPNELFKALCDEVAQFGRWSTTSTDGNTSNHSSSITSDIFWVLQCVLTPTAQSTINGHLLRRIGSTPHSLEHYSQMVRSPLLHYLSTEEWYNSQLNVVMVDHADDPELVRSIIRLNM
jgi:hypothetical protein